jgi:hypothetical protein
LFILRVGSSPNRKGVSESRDLDEGNYPLIH